MILKTFLSSFSNISQFFVEQKTVNIIFYGAKNNKLIGQDH